MKKTIMLAAVLALAALPAGASQFRAFDRTSQVKGSELIVVGNVAATWSEWSPDHSVIHTHAEIVLQEVWKGAAATDRIVVTTLGGTVDGVSLEIDGAARFVNGADVVLFLDETDGRLMPWGMRFGLYDLVGSGSDAFLVGALPPAVSGAQEFVQISIPVEDLRAEVTAVLEKEEVK